MITALNVDKIRLDMGDYVLSVQGLRKRLAGRDVLGGVDLDVKRGAFTTLVGPAGAGKSVTLACIAGSCNATRGRIRYFGYEIRRNPEARIARMGVVRTQQTPQSFGDMTVLETVTVSAFLRRLRRDRARQHAREILTLAGLGERASARFAVLDILDCKRLELARALATDPQILLLDDIAADLDRAQIAVIGDILGAARTRGITIVAAARSFEYWTLVADTCVAIEGGRTAERGVDAASHFRA